MNIQEAIDRIKREHSRFEEPYRLAIKALEVMPEYEKLKERDRAKKPIVKSNFYPDGSFEQNGHCPECNYDFGEEEWHFCPHCGQRIDWTEESS